MARARPRRDAVPRRARAELRVGAHAGRPPADRLEPVALRAPAAARACPVARSVQLPAGGAAARRVPGARLRAAVLAARRAVRRGGRVERLHAARAGRRRCAACAWLRALDLPRGAALAGGLAFALAPYRVAQSTGHLLGPISLFLPLALLGLEKRRAWLAGAALAAIPLSGQVHLALGAVPLFVAYALARGRGWRAAAPGAVAAVVAAELVQRFVIRGSLHESGRSLAEVGKYSAHWSDFVSRHGGGEDARPARLADAAARARRPRAAPARAPIRARVDPGRCGAGADRARARDEPADLRARAQGSSRSSSLAGAGAAPPIACLALAALLAFALARARPGSLPSRSRSSRSTCTRPSSQARRPTRETARTPRCARRLRGGCSTCRCSSRTSTTTARTSTTTSSRDASGRPATRRRRRPRPTRRPAGSCR